MDYDFSKKSRLSRAVVLKGDHSCPPMEHFTMSGDISHSGRLLIILQYSEQPHKTKNDSGHDVSNATVEKPCSFLHQREFKANDTKISSNTKIL